MLPFDILSNIAIRSESLNVAYVIDSAYAARRIIDVRGCLPRVLVWAAAVGGAFLRDKTILTTILESAKAWPPDDIAGLLCGSHLDWSFPRLWELAYMHRKSLRVGWYTDNMSVHVTSWLSAIKHKQRRGRWASRFTKTPWCPHCQHLLWNDHNHSGCEVTQKLDSMIKWKATASYETIFTSLFIAFSTLLGPRDPRWLSPTQIIPGYLEWMLNMTECLHFCEDTERNWVFVMNMYSSEWKDNRERLYVLMEKLQRARIHYDLEIFEHPSVTRPDAFPTLCVHCHPPARKLWILKAHRGFFVVFRICRSDVEITLDRMFERNEGPAAALVYQDLSNDAQYCIERYMRNVAETRLRKQMVQHQLRRKMEALRRANTWWGRPIEEAPQATQCELKMLDWGDSLALKLEQRPERSDHESLLYRYDEWDDYGGCRLSPSVFWWR